MKAISNNNHPSLMSDFKSWSQETVMWFLYTSIQRESTAKKTTALYLRHWNYIERHQLSVMLLIWCQEGEPHACHIKKRAKFRNSRWRAAASHADSVVLSLGRRGRQNQNQMFHTCNIFSAYQLCTPAAPRGSSGYCKCSKETFRGDLTAE